MKKLKYSILISLTLVLCLFSFSCKQAELKTYNEGINIIPTPQNVKLMEGKFQLNSHTNIYAPNADAQRVADFFAPKLRQVTGYPFKVVSTPKEDNISIIVDSTFNIVKEGYQLNISAYGANIKASTAQGAFYGMQTLMQLLPAEVESPKRVKTVEWEMPCVDINDYPRFDYRGVLLDPCRHFIPVDRVKKQLDVMALYKINTMHFHLTEDQGWRIEIKKYPKLTEVGSVRIEGDGIEHKGFYTQEEIKDIVAYANERFITVVPELEVPGHELAAIAAYPELSCQSKQVTPRIIWGVEDIVMCPGKGTMFTFLEDVVEEMVQLFPGTYFHIGGDECPKTSWKSCEKCQDLIKREGFKSDDKHSAEDYLQSYIVRHMENVLMKHGKRLIGWDEILEGGLSPNATVMSWRGESGGIQAAAQGHDVIMASHGNGMYLDQYQGDYKIEPTAIGGYTSLERTYNYNPVPDTLVALGQQHRVIGVQSNIWSEYMYTPDIMEYRMYPRVLALSEIAWTNLDQKDYNDFERRINNAYVRLDGHDINYHIPQPEQRYGSCNYVAFTDSATLDFTTSRPIKMVYTINGDEPIPNSTEYQTPLTFTKNTQLKIRSVLPSGKMSPTRTITIEQQTLAPSVEVPNKRPGLSVKKYDGYYLKAAELEGLTPDMELTVNSLPEITALNGGIIYKSGSEPHAAIATGYIDIPEDGVYFVAFCSNDLWIDGKLLITNEGLPKMFSTQDTSIALQKGLHEVKIVYLGHVIGGWPSWWDNADVAIRRADWKEFKSTQPAQLFH